MPGKVKITFLTEKWRLSAEGGLACMNRTSAEEKIQEMAEQIRNIICRWNSGEPFYTMIHVDGMVVVIDEKGYSVSDPKGKRLTVHRFYGSGFRKDA